MTWNFKKQTLVIIFIFHTIEMKNILVFLCFIMQQLIR